MESVFVQHPSASTMLGKVIWPRSPYKGLNYFTSADAPLFSQREVDLEDCAELIGIRTRLLILQGRSGTGRKSSFIRAGLLPRLIYEWGYVTIYSKENIQEPLVMRCTADPVRRMAQFVREGLNHPPLADLGSPELIGSLARQLDRLESESSTNLAKKLIDVLSQLTRNSRSPILFSIDQGEEVLSLTSDTFNYEKRERHSSGCLRSYAGGPKSV